MTDDNLSSRLLPTTFWRYVHQGMDYSTAISMIRDPSVFVQCNGLAALTTLIERRDIETMLNFHQVKNMFKTNVNQNEDIFIYTFSLLGLAACLTITDQIIELFPVIRDNPV